MFIKVASLPLSGWLLLLRREKIKKEANYYAVIPANVRYADIPANAKLLYGEITALANKEGFCWASDTYFSKLYGVTRQTVNGWVKKLCSNGFLKVSTKKSNSGTLRKIYVLGGVSQKDDTGVKKSRHGVSQKPDTNNTSINNTINTITNVIGTDVQKRGNEDINTVMDDLYKSIGLKPIKVRQQRIAASNLIKRHGLENTRKLIKIAIQLQETDAYASRITSMQDLWNKQNNILIAVKKNFNNNKEIRRV